MECDKSKEINTSILHSFY